MRAAGILDALAVMDRWVIAPAIVAGLCIAVAAVPPVGGLRSAVRVEAWGHAAAGRSVLVRATVADDEVHLRAPRAARWSARDASGRELVVESSPGVGTPYAFARVALAGSPPWSVDVNADSLRATARVTPTGTGAPHIERTVREPPHASGIDVAIEGGALVPDATVELFVRVTDGAGASVRLTPSDGLALVPAGAVTLDACGVASWHASLRALFASVQIDRVGGASRRVQLPVASGSLALQASAREVTAESPIEGLRTYWVAGDSLGVLRGGVRTLESRGDSARATVVLEDSDEWIALSASPTFDRAAGLWVRGGEPHCAGTSLGGRFDRAALSVPIVPDVTVWFDGPTVERERQSRQRRNVRMGALALAAAGLTFLSARVARTGLRPPPAGSETVDLPTRRRAAQVVMFVALFALVGIVLFAAFVLRAE